MNDERTKAIFSEIAQYYSHKLALHGESAQGVDWNSEESQQLRFMQLSKIISATNNFSISDLGCGYGAYLDYLSQNYQDFSYLGVDISPEMIQTATRRYQSQADSRFIVAGEPEQTLDYCVASGIFNIKLARVDSEWWDYICSSLDMMHQKSLLGFSFNCLTSYSDEDKKCPHLYYADPCRVFDFCKRRYSRQVALLHDYGLYEFTILVRKI